MAAYAALVSLMNDIEQIMNHPRLSNCFNSKQIQSILKKAGCLLDFIEGYKHGGLVTEEAYGVLEREIKSVADEAADVIESHIVDQILDEESTYHARNKVLDWVRRIPFVQKAIPSRDLRHLILDMDAVAKKAMEVKEKEGIREEEQPPTHPTTPHVGGSGSGETAMVGLEDELNQLLDSLTDHHSNRHVISIVGMGGTGKTTLAQNLYANPLVKEHFDIRAWATVSQQFDLQDILSQLISCIGKSDNIGELGEHVYKTLYGRRYLIVLDDIWGVEAWDKVRHNFPDDGSRSRVVLTTRLSNVASVCASTCIDVNLLDEETSWKLFCEKALFPQKDDPLQLENVAKKIVKSCKGLALSIVVIGGLLHKSPRTLGYWENILKSLETNDSKEKQRGIDVLSLSYNHLPPHLKPCFLYMGVFDEDSRIRVSKITELWVAEGFIKPKGSRVLEEIAEDYLKDLSDRNLILGVERRHTEKIKSFSIHDLVRDLCIKVAQQQEFFHVRKSRETQGGRRLVMKQHNTKVGSELVRSILGKDLGIRYRKYKLLRVLNAKQNVYLAQAFGNVNLRYLAINRRPTLNLEDVIPTSAWQLIWNLQTLIITNSYWSLVLAPLEIWKMRQLRHVKCSKVYLPDPRPPQNMQYYMENLQTLKTALNLRLSEEVCKIIPNIKKLHLNYKVNTLGYDYSLIECLHNLDRFHKLESLNMDIQTGRWAEPFLVYELAFPPSLKKLCLTHCRLSWEDLSVIGSLPQLQVLRLDFDAVTIEDHWRPISGQFLRLKFLEIESCKLYDWYADNSHFPVLEKLVLRQLYRLKEIPPEIGEIPTLGLIRMDRCSTSAAISAVKIKKDQVENQDYDALQIEVGIYSSDDLERFKERLEAEELGLDLFKLD